MDMYNFKNIISIPALIFVQVNTISCVSMESTTYSMSIPQVGKEIVSDVKQLRQFETELASILIEPLNEWVHGSGCFGTVLFIPVHVSHDGDSNAIYSDEFRIMLGIKSKQNDVLFDPKEIVLNYNNKTILPVNYIDYENEVGRCIHERFKKIKEEKILTDNYSVPNDDRWYCFELNYGIKNIQPNEDFSITFSNIPSKENSKQPKTVIFKEYKYTRRHDYGSRGC